LAYERPRTKDAVQTLKTCGVEGKVLLALTKDDINVAYAFRNIPGTHVILTDQLNTYDVLDADTVIFTRASLDQFQSKDGEQS